MGSASEVCLPRMDLKHAAMDGYRLQGQILLECTCPSGATVLALPLSFFVWVDVKRITKRPRGRILPGRTGRAPASAVISSDEAITQGLLLMQGKRTDAKTTNQTAMRNTVRMEVARGLAAQTLSQKSRRRTTMLSSCLCFRGGAQVLGQTPSLGFARVLFFELFKRTGAKRCFL